MNNNETYTCPNCNSDVNINSRCCMKCGYLNPYHIENAKYEQYMRKTSSYSVSNGALVDDNTTKNDTNIKAVTIGLGSKMGNYTVCFIVNLIGYIFLIGLLIFLYYNSLGQSISGLIGSNLYFPLFTITVFSLFLYSQQLIYMKMNRHWILSLIPLVNTYLLSDSLFENKLLNILVFIPGVNIIYYYVLLYQMGKAFNKSGILTVLFPFIMFPVIGFGGSSFRGVCYVANKDTLEKEFRKKKSYLKVAVFMIGCSLLMAIYVNIVSINKGIDQLSSTYIYFASQRVMRRTKIHVETKTYNCDSENGEMYFYFGDLNDYFSIPFYIFRDPIKGYVKVVKDDSSIYVDQYTYYISLTDEKYGFPETKFEDLKITSVEAYPSLEMDDSATKCYFNSGS